MTGSSDIRHEKAELRRRMICAREAIGVVERGAAAHACAARLPGLLRGLPPPVISAFLPIGAEIDPRPAMVVARKLGCRICLPVMVGRNLPLQFRAWSPGDPLEERQWGIREPSASAEPMQPGVLLMPLLAFDLRGGRLGYGGGYYDRTLRALRATAPVLAVGLAFDEQGVDGVPCLDYDERLDRVITPTRTIECQPGD